MGFKQYGVILTSRTYEIKNMRTRRIIPYRTILITGLSLVWKINSFYYEYVNRKSVYTSWQTHVSFCCLHFFRMPNFLIFYSLNIFVFKQSICPPMRSQPVLISQSNCCLNVIVEFHPAMKMYVYPAPGTLLLNCT